jgi:transposase
MNKALINLPEIHIQSISTTDSQISITAQTKAATAPCPHCGVVSQRIHSYYWRQGKDLPTSGQMTHVYVEAKRFRCLNQACSRSTFVERLDCLPRKAQRTQRLSSALQAVAFGLGGEAGCRLAA